MKAAIIFAVLTILGSLCQGKPVDKKKKLRDKPKQGKYLACKGNFMLGGQL